MSRASPATASSAAAATSPATARRAAARSSDKANANS